MLAAAMNPCPCGYFGDPTRECMCTPPMIQRYVAKISGPLLDRIDIHIEVPAVQYKELLVAQLPKAPPRSGLASWLPAKDNESASRSPATRSSPTPRCPRARSV